MTLNNMKPGEVGTIESINGDHHLQTRLVELGLLSGIEIRLIKRTPFKGPVEIKVRESYLSIRWDDAQMVDIK